MKHLGNEVEDLKIAYIGGGSRGWAWQLMSDLALAEDISGEVALYDVDFKAAQYNEVIGNKVEKSAGVKSVWKYKMYKTIDGALKGADFVIISILPGTFDEMESDVHTPEKYGIYQSVGDTSGPGGVIRAMRTIPMFQEIALAIEKNCPNAWVINYTNPMTVCVRALYKTFPKIKAFGCCHEVFGTQELLCKALKYVRGIENVVRDEIKVSVIGVNHFTWITKAMYNDIDLFEVYKEFAEKYIENGFDEENDNHWMNGAFLTREKVKLDLFRRYGVIAAAGDRHLAEFCPGYWYLKDLKQVGMWNFSLTPVSQRKIDLAERLEKSEALYNGSKEFEISKSGEEGVNQIRALLGLRDLVTNVNLPNVGQIPNLPLGVVVETNASFRSDSVQPINSGEIPMNIYSLITRIVGEQEMIVKAGINRDLDLAFQAFVNDPLVSIPIDDAKLLFDEMIDNTKKYLKNFNI